MANHRLDVAPVGRPPEPVTAGPSAPYVGKRRAAAPDAAGPAPSAPSAYVGRRRAAVVADVPESASVDESVPTAAELYTIVERRLEETAPAPRITRELIERVESTTAAPVPPVVPVVPVVPAPFIPLSDDTAIAIPRVDPATHPLQASLSDTAIALPRITLADDLDHDLLAQTASIAAVPASPGGRRRSADDRKRTLRGLPSLPVAAGVAALAVAVAGVVATGHDLITPAASRTVVQASALTGTSGTGVVGSRPVALSRDSSRDGGGLGTDTPADLAANERSNALKKNGQQAGSYDDYLKKHQVGLPIEAGEYHLTGRFGDVSGLWATIHTGLDFACPTGTPIHAVATGTITEVGWAGSYGNRTVETLPDGTELWYAHQSAFDAHVGEKVTMGEVMGYVGSTGNTTGPHVHLEVRPGGGDPVDPDEWLKVHGVDPDAHQA